MISRVRLVEMIKKELRQMIRDPRMRVLIFVAPIIQLMLFGYAVNTDVRNVKTFVVDNDNTARSREFLSAFTSSGHFVIAGRSFAPRDMTHALDDGEASIGIAIPRGFARDLDRGDAVVQIVIDGSDSNTGNVVQGYATRIVQRFALDRVQDAGSTAPGRVDIRARALYNPALESRVYNVPAVIGALLLIVTLLLTSMAVVREREVGTLDQLMVTPIKPLELMLGKTLPVALVGMVDLVLISTVAIAWFGIPFRGMALELALAALLYIMAGLSFGLLISTISRTQQEAFMTMFLFILPAIILSGFMYPISSMPVVFQWLTILDPVRHFLEIVRGIFLKGTGLKDLWPQYVILAVMTFAIMTVAVRRFRRSLG